MVQRRRRRTHRSAGSAGEAAAITIKDVARAAGVSVATVSRVWNDSDTVSEDTRRHVLAVASQLGYAPHGAARSLITSRTSTIGVLLPDLYGEFFSEVIRGIDQTVQQHGYHLLVSSSHDDQREVAAALRNMRGRVDGLIVMSPDLDTHVALRTLPPHYPVVLLNCAVAGDPYHAITIENYEGARAMTRHLIALGHRVLAHIAGAPRNYDALERRRGFRDAVREAGIPEHEACEVAGDFSELSGYRAASELLHREPRPTAIFAANDSMAIGALSAIRECGITVPGEMAVAGFDDIPMARYMNPPLTSVHVDIHALGERATRSLLEAMHDSSSPQRRQDSIPTTLVIRRSCGTEDRKGRSPPT